MKTIHVLVCAYACEPGKGSEPEVGWKWVEQIASFAEVWVITRSNNQGHIEATLAKKPNPNLHFTYTDIPKWASFWKRGGRGIRLYYFLWQFWMFKKAMDLKRDTHFDLCHHITFVNDWIPSLLAFSGLPFVWGPIGSNRPISYCFLPNARAKFLETIRFSLQQFLRVLNPLFYQALLKASVVVGIDPGLSKKFPFCLYSNKKFFYQSAIAVDLASRQIMTSKESEMITILMVGRLIYIKGFHLGIEAFAKVFQKYKNLKLEILGSGMEMDSLKKQVERLGINNSVVFTGNVPREEVLEKMKKMDMFLFPSFEGGGMVVLEAMSVGKPIVCLNFGGPAEMVSDDCGVKVSGFSREEIVNKLKDALEQLINSAELRFTMGEAGRRRVEELYNWRTKGEFARNIYSMVLGADSN